MTSVNRVYFTPDDVEMLTFECKRSLFYSCRILGHNKEHIQYATICAKRVSNSRGHAMSSTHYCSMFGLWVAAGQRSHHCAASVD